MEDEARMSWLSGRPQRVLNLRAPAELLSGSMDYFAQWSVMDDQIMLALPAKQHVYYPSLIYLADITASLGRDDNVVELKKVTELPFLTSSLRLLSNRAGFVTAEFRESENKLILRTHNLVGSITKERTISANAIDGEIAVHGSSIAFCICDDLGSPFANCLGKSNKIVLWDTESGNLTKIEIPQDKRGYQCHRGNLQFATSSHIALGGHIDVSHCDIFHGGPYAVLRSIPIAPLEHNKGRYFHHHENFEYNDNYDTIAIPGSSARNDIIIHHHQHGHRFTAADVGLITGETPSEAQPTPRSYIDRNYLKDLFHTFSDNANARTLSGSIFDRLPSIIGNKVLIRENIEEYEHDQDNYYGYKTPHSSQGIFHVLYLYDFDQGRCKALRQLSPQSERQDLETRLKERNPNANVTVTSRMFYTSIEEECDNEKDTSPEWQEHIKELQRIRWAREEGKAKFPTLEFDDPPEGNDDPRMLFIRSMICLPKLRDGEKLAITTSAIIELPSHKADGYVHYFGTE